MGHPPPCVVCWCFGLMVKTGSGARRGAGTRTQLGQMFPAGPRRVLGGGVGWG